VSDRLRRLWDFDDLEATRGLLLGQLELESTDSGRAEVLTQLARLSGLGGDAARGERLLAEAEAMAGSSAAARIRIHLERGRLRRSSGDVASALARFEAAYEAAVASSEQFMAADAAHMAALAAPDQASRIEWTRRGIDITEAAHDREVAYWAGPLLNNLGCDYAESGRHEAALDAFRRALDVRLRYPETPEAIAHARASVAEALRAVGREQEAEAMEAL
jgi:tetratricopeptide (TPR) repeat protein